MSLRQASRRFSKVFAETQIKLGTGQTGRCFASGGFLNKTAERFIYIVFKTVFLVKRYFENVLLISLTANYSGYHSHTARFLEQLDVRKVLIFAGSLASLVICPGYYPSQIGFT